MGKKRIEWIDIARGYGILLMILGHLDVGMLGKWIYSFHMPLFFFLSGILFKRYGSFKQMLLRKSKGILIPYYCLGIPVVLLQLFSKYRNNSLDRQAVLTEVGGFLFQRRYMVFWFLTCLFLLNIIFWFLIRFLYDEKKILLVSFAAVVIGEMYYYMGGKPLIWNVDVCLMALPFFAIGYIYGRHAEELENYLKVNRYRILILSLLINLICQYIGVHISGTGLEMYRSSYGFIPLTYIAAFAGIAFMIIFSRMVKSKVVRYIGENSMLYFAWHGVVVNYITSRVSQVILNAGLQENVGFVLDKTVQMIIILAVITMCNYIILLTRFRFVIGK